MNAPIEPHGEWHKRSLLARAESQWRMGVGTKTLAYQLGITHSTLRGIIARERKRNPEAFPRRTHHGNWHLSILIPVGLKNKVQRRAIERGTSISSYMRYLVTRDV